MSWHGLCEMRAHFLIDTGLHIFLPRFWKQLLHSSLEKESQFASVICFQLWTTIPQDQLCKKEGNICLPRWIDLLLSWCTVLMVLPSQMLSLSLQINCFKMHSEESEYFLLILENFPLQNNMKFSPFILSAAFKLRVLFARLLFESKCCSKLKSLCQTAQISNLIGLCVCVRACFRVQ